MPVLCRRAIAIVFPALVALASSGNNARAEEVTATPGLRAPDDLRLEVVLSDPKIAQPLQISFDARGRMWVVEYRQYPFPAGLRVVSRDNFWRVVYDKIPAPPPYGDKGKAVSYTHLTLPTNREV